MTDKEKLIAIKSFIEGVFDGAKYTAYFSREGWEDFLKSLDNNEII